MAAWNTTSNNDLLPSAPEGRAGVSNAGAEETEWEKERESSQYVDIEPERTMAANCDTHQEVPGRSKVVSYPLYSRPLSFICGPQISLNCSAGQHPSSCLAWDLI